jgi:hypothetical protein
VAEIERDLAMSPHPSFPDSHELHRWARRQRSAALAAWLAKAAKALGRALSERDDVDPELGSAEIQVRVSRK